MRDQQFATGIFCDTPNVGHFFPNRLETVTIETAEFVQGYCPAKGAFTGFEQTGDFVVGQAVAGVEIAGGNLCSGNGFVLLGRQVYVP